MEDDWEDSGDEQPKSGDEDRAVQEARRKLSLQARISAAASTCPLSSYPQGCSFDYNVDQALSKKQIMQLLDALYKDHPTRLFNNISREAIEEQDKLGDLIYGEVSFLALAYILERHLPNCQSGGRVFYDLGSGAGRPIFAAALLHPFFTKLCGIELIEGLAAASQELQFLFSKEILPHLPPAYHAQQIAFQYGDFLTADWSDGDVVLSNSTCFTAELMARMEERAAQLMRPGALFITLTHRFQSAAAWELLESFERRMSWGPAEVFVHRRTAAPAPAPNHLAPAGWSGP